MTDVNPRSLALVLERKLPDDYPVHPSTVLVRNRFYEGGLTEHMVWKHLRNHERDLLHQLRGRRVLTVVKTDHGAVVRRKDGDGHVVVNEPSDLQGLNSGRAMELHVVVDQETDLAWVDLDPGEAFPFERTKETAVEMTELIDFLDPQDVGLKFSGGRGFHVLARLAKVRPVDELRHGLVEKLDEFCVGRDGLTTKFTDDPDSMRLDVSTLHESGSIRAGWSLNAETGLISLPVEPEWLDDFEKGDAVVSLPKELEFEEFEEDPNSTSGQMRWRMRDPDSFMKGSFRTWRSWEDVREEGLSFVVGDLRRPVGETAVQALRFDRKAWDAESAGKWWEENWFRFDKLWRW